MKIKPIFAWYDLWVGVYWDSSKRRLYIFPVPMLGIVIYYPRKRPSAATAMSATDTDSTTDASANSGCAATPCSQSSDHWKLLKIWANLDEIMHAMRPRWHGTPSMCGRYPCWIVWLPTEGTTERKTIKDAMIDFVDQEVKNQKP